MSRTLALAPRLWGSGFRVPGSGFRFRVVAGVSSAQVLVPGGLEGRVAGGLIRFPTC